MNGEQFLRNIIEEHEVKASLVDNSSLGHEVLEEVKSFCVRFISYPNEEARTAHALWIAHTHLIDYFESTPRLAALSPEPASGKSRLIEITSLLVPNPVEAVNVTPAYLFRKVGDEEAGKPTILYDEIDTVFGPKARENEEIRGLLNAGHRNGAVAGRCISVGNTVKTEEIPAYCAVALAGLGNLPDTILSRSVVIRMRPRSPSENVEPFRRRVHSAEGSNIKGRLSDWCKLIESRMADNFPKLPESVQDRDADVWEPLITIADAAGGNWPILAREAAVALVAESKETSPSLGVRLLSDIREILVGKVAVSTEVLLKKLNDNEELPWGSLGGTELDARRLGAMLKKYIEIPDHEKSRNLRIGERVVKGYREAWFYDAWERYLPAELESSATSATNASGQENVMNVADVAVKSEAEQVACPACLGEGGRCLHCGGTGQISEK